LTVSTDTAADLATEQQRIAAEIRELDLLVESTQTEVNRLKAREEQSKLRVSEVRGNPGNFQREEIFGATDDYATAIGRRMTMEGQLGTLQAKRKLLDRAKSLLSAAQQHVRDNAAAPAPPDASPVIDESKLLQAVVDPQRSRTELAALRQMVNKTLQELRGFIFELRPMILDDLGLVPTMRRYVQTLVDKHGIRIDFSSTGRDRRLPSDDEVAIFRLIQDSLVERIEKGASKDIVLGMGWKDEQLDIMLQADGKELPPDGELQSGLRRSERLELLHGESTHETRSDGTVVLSVKVPIRVAPTIIT
jgi:two-component system sensor histidine kinase DegS